MSYDSAGNPVEQSITYEERVELARKTIVESELLMPVLVDEIDNPMWCSYGERPNNAYLIGMDGNIVVYQHWNNPTEMEAEIIELLGL
jgi:hypothetical protein